MTHRTEYIRDAVIILENFRLCLLLYLCYDASGVPTPKYFFADVGADSRKSYHAEADSNILYIKHLLTIIQLSQRSVYSDFLVKNIYNA